MHRPPARRLPLPHLEIINPLEGFIGTEDQARNKPADMFKPFRTTKDLSEALHPLGKDLRHPNNRQHGFTLLFLSHPYFFGPSLLPLHYKAIVNKHLKIKDKSIFLACLIMFLSYIAKGFYNKSSGAPRETGMSIRGVSTLSK